MKNAGGHVHDLLGHTLPVRQYPVFGAGNLTVWAFVEQHWRTTRNRVLPVLHPVHQRFSVHVRSLPPSEIFWWLCDGQVCQSWTGRGVQGCGQQLHEVMWEKLSAPQYGSDQGDDGGLQEKEDPNQPHYHHGLGHWAGWHLHMHHTLWLYSFYIFILNLLHL